MIDKKLQKDSDKNEIQTPNKNYLSQGANTIKNKIKKNSI